VTAIFLLTLIQRVFCGPLNSRWAQMPDLTLRERALVVVPIALMFVLGIWPQFVLGVVDATVVKNGPTTEFLTTDEDGLKQNQSEQTYKIWSPVRSLFRRQRRRT